MRTLYSLGITASLVLFLLSGFSAIRYEQSNNAPGEQIRYISTLADQHITELTDLHTTPGLTETVYLPIVQKPAVPGSFLGKIAFSSTRTGNDEIFSINADGTDLIQLTNDPRPDSDPDWSPDNVYIVFTKQYDNENSDIYRMRADGTELINLTNYPGKDFHPTWSPDGTKIAFTSVRDSKYGIYVMNADGSNPQNLTNSSFPLSLDDQRPAWSPDGTQIAFMRSVSGDAIYIMNADGSNQTEFLAAAGTFYGNPTWSPDGTQIAFDSRDPGDTFGNNIFTINVDGTNMTQLTTISPSSVPTWSPDGTQIAFMTDRDDGNYEIYVMNPDGSLQQNVTQNPLSDRIPAWSH